MNSRNPRLIGALRKVLDDLEQAAGSDDTVLADLKRIILCRIADLEIVDASEILKLPEVG
jgi:hypothetical protein